MSTREVRCYEYVNRPYEQVREALLKDARGVFKRATTAAAARASSLATTLRVQVGALEVGAEIDVTVDMLDDARLPGQATPVSRLLFSWRAAHNPALFPTMDATLSIYPLSTEETQLDLEGHYHPPLGALGAAADALLGHRVAEASVHRFLEDVVEQLKLEVAGR